MDREGSCAELLGEHTAHGRHVVVGLDTTVERLPASVAPSDPPADRVAAFNRDIVEQTADLVCAYKPNIAFYEALGADGFRTLKETIDSIRRVAPGVPVIVDAKRADIGSTNLGYVASIFDELGADAVTVHPYLGREALAPFLEREDRLLFVLARTSNPGAGEFQDLIVEGRPLYRQVAHAVATTWNESENCGLVVGATYPEELRQVRADTGPDIPILIPGVGAQGGDLAAVVDIHQKCGSDAFFVNSSRAILYASSDEHFAAAARAATQTLSEEIASLMVR